MFTQKPSSAVTKHGDIATFFLLTALFVGGGFLLSRHISFAVPLLIMLVLSTLPLLAARVMLKLNTKPVPIENNLTQPLPNVEWKQIVGKDGEIVEVGYIKKKRTDVRA